MARPEATSRVGAASATAGAEEGLVLTLSIAVALPALVLTLSIAETLSLRAGSLDGDVGFAGGGGVERGQEADDDRGGSNDG